MNDEQLKKSAAEPAYVQKVRELIQAKIDSKDDTNALQFAQEVLDTLGMAPHELTW